MAFLPIAFTLNPTRSARAARHYGRAASVAHTTVSAMKNVFALNAVPELIRQYTLATQEAFEQAIQVIFKEGLGNGGMLGSFMVLYCILVLYRTSLLHRYKDFIETGCDPSGGVTGNHTCDSSESDVFGAMLGIIELSPNRGQRHMLH